MISLADSFQIVSTIVFICRFGEAVLTFEDEEFFGYEADTYDWSKHPCRRKCIASQQPKSCHYVFVVEQFSTMSKACYDCPYNITDCFRPHCIPADGVQKRIYVANRQFPGPLVEVCESDTLVVDVRNRMLSESTTIHWHGFQQDGTPYMDGVPYVTQCPILPGENFRYIFNATTPGTFFWHSHIGSQRGDGLFGPMIVNRLVGENVYKDLYDYDEHVLLVNDWAHDSGDTLLVREYYYSPDVTPTNILINGLGRFQRFFTDNQNFVYTPSTVFHVEKNKRYRFRLINAGVLDCPIEMSIDNHTMTIVSLDGHDIVSVEADAITSYSGERVDFIVQANQLANNYWIRFRGYTQCGPIVTSGIYQVAILSYNNVALQDPKAPIGYELPKLDRSTRILNPHNDEDDKLSAINIINLTSVAENDVSLNNNIDHQIYITYDFYHIDNYGFARKELYSHYEKTQRKKSMPIVQLNRISLKLPAFPLLSQRDLLTTYSFCNDTNPPRKLNCTNDYCACTHVIQVRLHSVVELILIDEGKGVPFLTVQHPFHLHGHFFRVVADEKLNGPVTIDRIKQLDKKGKIKRRLDHAPIKDTMKIHKNGYVIARFYANNPGYWFFHCHLDEHSNVGMALVFKVGEHEDFPNVPKGFPRCGGFTPSIM